MRFKWWTQFERSGAFGEIIEPEQIPLIAKLVCDLNFIPRDVKRSSLPAVRRFHLDQTITAVWGEARDVAAYAITIFQRHLSNPSGEVVSICILEKASLMVKHALFPGVTQCTIAFVSASDIRRAAAKPQAFRTPSPSLPERRVGLKAMWRINEEYASYGKDTEGYVLTR